MYMLIENLTLNLSNVVITMKHRLSTVCDLKAHGFLLPSAPACISNGVCYENNKQYPHHPE